MEKVNFLTNELYKVCVEVFEVLGSGHSEEDYQRALAIEFGIRKEIFQFFREVQIETYYKEFPLTEYKLDFVVCPVDKKFPKFIIETKKESDLNSFSATSMAPRQQVLSYLRNIRSNNNEILRNIDLAFLVNFGRKINFESESMSAKENLGVSLECWKFIHKKNSIKLLKSLPEIGDEDVGGIN